MDPPDSSQAVRYFWVYRVCCGCSVWLIWLSDVYLHFRWPARRALILSSCWTRWKIGWTGRDTSRDVIRVTWLRRWTRNSRYCNSMATPTTGNVRPAPRVHLPSVQPNPCICRRASAGDISRSAPTGEGEGAPGGEGSGPIRTAQRPRRPNRERAYSVSEGGKFAGNSAANGAAK